MYKTEAELYMIVDETGNIVRLNSGNMEWDRVEAVRLALGNEASRFITHTAQSVDSIMKRDISQFAPYRWYGSSEIILPVIFKSSVNRKYVAEVDRELRVYDKAYEVLLDVYKLRIVRCTTKIIKVPGSTVQYAMYFE